MPPATADAPPIGRIEVWDALLRRREKARAGSGGMTLLEGAAGVGKSSFFDAVVDDSRRSGFQVFRARAAPLENPPPFLVLQEAILSAELEARSDAVPVAPFPFLGGLGSAGLPLSARSEPEDSTGSLPPLAAHLLASVDGPSGRHSPSRQRLLEGFAEPLVWATARGPVLFGLDDLQFVDPATLEFLSFLAPRLRDHAIWLFATTGPFDRSPPGQRSAVEQWVTAGHADRLTLRPLTEREAMDFVRWVDPGREALPHEVSRWHEATGGVPVLLEQVVRGRDGALRRGPGRVERRPVLEVPRALLAELTEPELKLLTVAAVVGREASFALLLKATGQPEETLAEEVERLVEQGVLREKPGEVFEFLKEDLRFELYSRLTGPRLRILHRRVGEAIESLGPPDLTSVYALARHFYLGRVDEKATDYNRRAAEFAQRTHSSNVAWQHLEQALEAHRRAFPGDLAGELDLVLQIAVERDHVGELKGAEQILRETLARPQLLAAATPDQSALVGLLLGRVLCDQGRWEEADRSVVATRPSVDRATDTLLKVYALRLRGEILFYRAEYPEALRLHEEALQAASAAGNEREVAIEKVRLANVLSMLPGRVAEAFPAYREASRKLRELGDNAEASYASLCLGVVLSQQGQVDSGLDELRVAAELAERAHDLRRMGWVEFNIADLERMRRRLPEAEDHNRRARELLEGIGDRFGLGQTYLNEGKLHLLAGETDLAARALAEAERLFREEKLPGDEVEVALRQGEVDLARGHVSEARGKLLDLERRELVRIRPDLAEEYHQLGRRVKEREAGLGDPPA